MTEYYKPLIQVMNEVSLKISEKVKKDLKDGRKFYVNNPNYIGDGQDLIINDKNDQNVLAKAWLQTLTEEPLIERFRLFLDKAQSGRGDSDRHLLSLFSLVVSSHARNVLELGVRAGDTSLPLLQGVKLNSGILDSVDIKESEWKPPSDLSDSWRFHKQDAIQFLEECVQAGRKFDLIYLDDWHEWSHVAKELELIDKLVTPSSIVLVHDCMYSTNNSPYYHMDLSLPKENQWGRGGPARAILELNQQFWEWSTLPYANGLTILRKKYSSKY